MFLVIWIKYYFLSNLLFEYSLETILLCLKTGYKGITIKKKVKIPNKLKKSNVSKVKNDNTWAIMEIEIILGGIFSVDFFNKIHFKIHKKHIKIYDNITTNNLKIILLLMSIKKTGIHKKIEFKTANKLASSK